MSKHDKSPRLNNMKMTGSQPSVSDIMRIAKIPKFLMLTERNVPKILNAYCVKGECLTEIETVEALLDNIEVSHGDSRCDH
jgi:hypothetical protein